MAYAGQGEVTMPAQAISAPGGSGAASRASYSGTGEEMFGQLIVGFLLTAITLGIYSPWFLCRLYRYLYSKTTFGPTARGNVRFEFTGTGGDFFVTFLVGLLLTSITWGIYGFWFLNNMIRFFADNSVGVTDDGTRYQLKYQGTGGQLFRTLFVGGLLTVITIGIYAPWFICKLQKTITSQMQILENGQPAGNMDFVGTGGDLFAPYMIGGILINLTLGIYIPWFQVRMNQFMLGHTRWTIHGQVYRGEYTGTGGQLLGKLFLGGLLTLITAGIYYFWFLTNLIKYQTDNTVVRAV
jgi:uncharacterized membrane protein YjgN (DUF898 family)